MVHLEMFQVLAVDLKRHKCHEERSMPVQEQLGSLPCLTSHTHTHTTCI